MEALVLVSVCAIVAAIGYRWRARTVVGVETSLCLTCVNAMVIRGAGGQVRDACTYGGGVRRMQFAVCSCSCYRSSQTSSSLVRIEGFAGDAREVYEEVAIS